MKYPVLWILSIILLITLSGCVSKPQEDQQLDSSSTQYGNLALNKIAVSNGDDAVNSPLMALDGDENSVWTSEAVDDTWLIVDLGYNTTIDSVQISWESQAGSKYEIQSSADAFTWETISSQTSSAGGQEGIDGFEVECRYVRFFGIASANQAGYSIKEIEVFGSMDMKKEEIFQAQKAKQSGDLLAFINRYYIEPTFDNPPVFNALLTTTIPVIDGLRDDIWDSAIKYPLPFNQLNTADLGDADPVSISGSWQVLFNGHMLYGIVYRTDDITYIKSMTIHENDCVELYIDQRGRMEQIRALVGQDFIAKSHPVVAAWSEDGSILEYSVDLQRELDGKIINWNIALADTDGRSRTTQLYPLNGSNHSWQGYELGELVFGTSRDKKTNMQVPPFKARSTEMVTVDGDPREWDKGYYYPMAYNQLNTKDLTVDPANCSAKFALNYIEGTIYGILLRTDDITFTEAGEDTPWENDAIEILLASEDKFYQLRSIVGQNNFDKGYQGGATEAVWNEEGTVLEFMIQISDISLKEKTYGFNITLSDNDGEGRAIQLYPINGVNDSWEGINLGELFFE